MNKSLCCGLAGPLYGMQSVCGTWSQNSGKPPQHPTVCLTGCSLLVHHSLKGSTVSWCVLEQPKPPFHFGFAYLSPDRSLGRLELDLYGNKVRDQVREYCCRIFTQTRSQGVIQMRKGPMPSWKKLGKIKRQV